MLPRSISYPRFQRASDHSLLVTFGGGISRDHHNAVARLFTLLQLEPNPATLNIHPAYASLLISFNPLTAHPDSFGLYLRNLVSRLGSVELPPPRIIEVPVCYDARLAPDLRFVAQHTGLSEDDVIRRHCSVEYLVYFIGFSPGFAYMGELPLELATPRLPTPRLNVPPGSIAIGGEQTGIYSVKSPGGWRIIGRTPLNLFQLEMSPPTLLQMGNHVQFRPIHIDEFLSHTTNGV
jgi:inhibitor of KinA